MLLEIIKSIFGVTFQLAQIATLRDESRPQWLTYALAGCYYVLPLMLIVSSFISWKMAVVVAVAFIISLVVGAATEGDDIWTP